MLFASKLWWNNLMINQRKLGRFENRGNMPTNVGGIYSETIYVSLKKETEVQNRDISGPTKRIVTDHKRSLGQVMFLYLSVILFMGGGSLYDVNSCLATWSHVPSGGSLSLVPCPFWRGYLSQGVSVPGGLCILRILVECILVFKKLTKFCLI